MPPRLRQEQSQQLRRSTRHSPATRRINYLAWDIDEENDFFDVQFNDDDDDAEQDVVNRKKRRRNIVDVDSEGKSEVQPSSSAEFSNDEFLHRNQKPRRLNNFEAKSPQPENQRCRGLRRSKLQAGGEELNRESYRETSRESMRNANSNFKDDNVSYNERGSADPISPSTPPVSASAAPAAEAGKLENFSMVSLESIDGDFNDAAICNSLVSGSVVDADERKNEFIVDDINEGIWENVGATKEDDDRVVEEVHLRFEVAKTLCAEIDNSGQSSKGTLLEQLLDKSDKYIGFMLARSLAGSSSSAKNSMNESFSAAGLPSGSTAKNKQSRTLKRSVGNTSDLEEELLMKEVDDELTGHQSGYWTRLTQQPVLLSGGTLKPYQLEGLNWLIHLYESGLNGILADEMGLGKTVQTISLLAYLNEARNIKGPHLVLAPKSTLGNWFNEIRRFAPSLKPYRFYGNREERRVAKESGDLDPNSKSHEIIITSYELCIKEKAVLKKFNFRYIIVDEAHRIKNEASKLSTIIRQFKSQFRLLLTGTPLQNNLRELWSLLNFLFPEMFSSSEEFDRMFDLTGNFDESSKTLPPEEKTARNAKIVSKLHKILKPFLLRRLKLEVAVEIPPKTELLLYIPLSPMQKGLYKDLLAKNVEFLTDTGGRVRLLNLAMQLRKACNHPYLFEGYEDKTLNPFGDHLIYNSGKLLLLDRLLEKLTSNESRVLIFTQMTRMLDILEDYCRIRSFSYCRLDGSSLGEERERQIEEFNAVNSPHSIFLLSTRAGGLGINLSTADTVIIYDSDFNPQVDLQAMDRAHRIGQKKHVNVYRLIHEHTIEEKIIERAMLKLRLDTAVIQQGRLSDQQSQQQMSKTDLMRLVQFGADQIYKATDTEELTDKDIDAILQRGEERLVGLSERLERHFQKKTTNLLDFDFSSVANLYEFEGVDYNADRSAWAEMGVSILEEERNCKRKVRIAQEQLEELQRQQYQIQHQQALAANAMSANLAKNKIFKLPRMEDWQFYERQKIVELHNKELEFLSNSIDGFQDKQGFKEREEKKLLLSKGFGSWSKKDFYNLIKSCESLGMSNTENIARDIGKTEEEVKRYIETFIERYSELADGEKLLKRMKSGNDVDKIKQEKEQILIKRLEVKSRNSWEKPTIKFPKSKTHFTDAEDWWLLNAALVVGYGNWDKLQTAINSDPHWTFNWFMRSRTVQDLGRRIEFLVKQLQKEATEETETRSKARETVNKMNSATAIEVNNRIEENSLFYNYGKNDLYKCILVAPSSISATATAAAAGGGRANAKTASAHLTKKKSFDSPSEVKKNCREQKQQQQQQQPILAVKQNTSEIKLQQQQIESCVEEQQRQSNLKQQDLSGCIP